VVLSHNRLINPTLLNYRLTDQNESLYQKSGMEQLGGSEFPRRMKRTGN
jgi:hypothetical protein